MKSGDLSANYFQTIPYLEDFAKQHNLDYEILVSVHLEPLGLYSKKVKSLKDIPDGSQIAIPSDPTNEGRALKVLEYSGLIKLREGATLLAGLNPAKNAIALEEKSSPFGNVVVVRKGDAQKEEFQKLKKVLTSPEVKKFIEEKYEGGVIPVF